MKKEAETTEAEAETTETKSKSKNKDNKIKFAEVFTPPSLVKEILSLIDLKNKNFKDCRIYEPGFGQGAFYNEVNNEINERT
jgi:type I restriction-modification system DNA methylase subunit